MTCRPRTRAELAAALHDARRRLLASVADLTDTQLRVPHEEILNPFLWEIGHVAWFHERFILRQVAGRAPLREDADRHWDSIEVLHDTRWDLILPSREETLAYMSGVFDAVLERLETVELTPAEWEVHLLALGHEDMHVEAFAYMRQTVGYPGPQVGGDLHAEPCECAGEVEFAGGAFLLGAAPEVPFAFDNERDQHEVQLAPFALARAPVTEAQFLAFVEDDGYARPELWSREGWTWRAEAGAEHPIYWRRDGAAWSRRAWNQQVPLEECRPVSHVNAHEAEAWCRWAGLRLPTEAEWEFAARSAPHPWGPAPCDGARANLDFEYGDLTPVGACEQGDSPDGVRQLIGNLWEWTASEFKPYPDFRPGLYREFSEPWFTDHRVLRGGCWATAGRLIRSTWRNFYLPVRRDVWCGFRAARDLD